MKYNSPVNFDNCIMGMVEEDDVNYKNSLPRNYLVFYSQYTPKISIINFITSVSLCNIVSKSNIEICKIYCLALLYRLCKITDFKISWLNCHRLILTMLMITSKFLEDDYFCNNKWAKSVGISVREINNMESILLKLLDYNVFISMEQIMHINKSMVLNK